MLNIQVLLLWLLLLFACLFIWMALEILLFLLKAKLMHLQCFFFLLQSFCIWSYDSIYALFWLRKRRKYPILFSLLLIDFKLTSSCHFELALGSSANFSNMQSIKKSILSHVNLRRSAERWFLAKDDNVLMHFRCRCSSAGASSDPILDRVIRRVKKYDKINAAKVFQL